MKPQSIKILIRETNVNYYAWSLIIDGVFFLPFVKSYLDEAVAAGVMEIINESGTYGFDMENWEHLGKSLMLKLEQKKFPLQKLVKDHQVAGSRVMKLCSHIEQQDLRKPSILQMKKWLLAIWPPFLKLNSVGFMPVISDLEHNYITNRLVSTLKIHGVSADKVQSVLGELITPTKTTLFWTEQKELLELANRYRSISKIKKSSEFERHVQKYIWLNYGYQGPISTEADLLNRIKNILFMKKSVPVQLREHRSHWKNLKKKQSQLLRQLKLNRKERYLFDAAKEFVYLKGYRVEVRHHMSYISDLIFAELSKRLHLHPKFFRYATRQETIRILEGKPVNKKAILGRIRHTIEIMDHKKRTLYSPRPGRLVLKRLVKEEEISKSEVFQGQVAYAGQVRGKAKIVYTTADLEKVQHGDVLVAVTTNPDFLPAMYRAIGFVTDAGGITSHAAIVARELKKPCVIGTKIATRVFKDGDLVEVDANKGVVRKIK